MTDIPTIALLNLFISSCVFYLCMITNEIYEKGWGDGYHSYFNTPTACICDAAIVTCTPKWVQTYPWYKIGYEEGSYCAIHNDTRLSILYGNYSVRELDNDGSN